MDRIMTPRPLCNNHKGIVVAVARSNT